MLQKINNGAEKGIGSFLSDGMRPNDIDERAPSIGIIRTGTKGLSQPAENSEYPCVAASIGHKPVARVAIIAIKGWNRLAVPFRFEPGTISRASIRRSHFMAACVVERRYGEGGPRRAVERVSLYCR